MSTTNSTTNSTSKKAKKRKAKKQKLKHTTDSEERITTDLKDCVASFKHCLSGNQSKLETELNSILLNTKPMANRKEKSILRNGGGISNPNTRKRTKNATKSAPSSSSTSSFATNNNITTPNTGGIIAVKDTPEELRRREQRLMRFGTPTAPTPTPTPTVTKNSWTPNGRIVGTANYLEKPYFRLTSAPDPSTVRPAHMLNKAYIYVKQQWDSDNDYRYTCEQLKSIRQDMTVQGIRGKFAVRVYEYHARIALQMGDLSEYNQCQSQLRELYNEGNVSKRYPEFIGYEILYLLFSGNRSEMNALLAKISGIKDEKEKGGKESRKALKHALAVRTALAVGNYHKFFQLYLNAPGRNGFIMDRFVPRERIKALLMLCKTFPMGLPLDFIKNELAFYNTGETVEFLEEHGITVDKVKNHLETKPAVPHLQSAIQNKYQKADIKGQI